MELITKADAKSLGLLRFFDGRTCKNGHVAERYVRGNRCVACALENSSKQANKTPGKYKPDMKAAYYIENKERIQARKTSDQAARRGMSVDDYVLMLKERKERRAATGGRPTPEQAARYARSYYEKHAAEIKVKARARKRKVKHQTPSWASVKEMAKFYRLAERLTRTTGIEHHVDHIVPLFGGLVSGLHCQQNLRVVTAEVNLAKSNKFDPDTYAHDIPPQP